MQEQDVSLKYISQITYLKYFFKKTHLTLIILVNTSLVFASKNTTSDI